MSPHCVCTTKEPTFCRIDKMFFFCFLSKKNASRWPLLSVTPQKVSKYPNYNRTKLVRIWWKTFGYKSRNFVYTCTYLHFSAVVCMQMLRSPMSAIFKRKKCLLKIFVNCFILYEHLPSVLEKKIKVISANPCSLENG
jgi:hypothetical protein